MSPLLKNILIAFALALIAALGYYIFVKEDDTSLVSEDAEATEAILDGQEFLMRVRQLDQIKFDSTVLKDQRFTSLINFTTEPEDEDVGRDNPFEPLKATR